MKRLIHVLRPEFWGLILPPLFFFGWMILTPQTIGNDYVVYQVSESLHYRVFHSLGIEPMWDVFQTGGVPVSAHAFAQIFHFPAWLLSHLPGFWTGHAIVLFTAKHIVLAILGQFITFWVLLRISRFSKLGCYLLSFLCIYNLRTLDALRYGAAFDTFIYGLCFLMLGLLYVDAARPWLLLPIALFFQFFVTSGYYPALPHICLAFLVSIFVIIYLNREKYSARIHLKLFALIGAATLAGMLLSAPNWLPFLEFIQVNYGRVQDASIGWSNYRPLNPTGVFLNLFQPWSAEVHSGFGGCTLLTLIVCSFITFGIRDFRNSWVILLVIALPFLLAFGAADPLYVFFYKYVPGFSMIRAPGRVMIILPIFLIASFLALEKRLSADREKAKGIV